MNKFISMILLCALLLSCFAGCATPNAPVDENLPGDEENSTPNDTTDEEVPDNEIDPAPEDNEDEKNPDNEGNEAEKNPDDEGDSTPDDDTDEKNPDNGSNLPQHDHGNMDPASGDTQNTIDAEELKKVFDQIRADVETNAKLEFWVEYEQKYYELKNTDEYDHCEWLEPCFMVVVSCSYKDAVNEDWYQQCSATDTVSLNKAFHDEYGGNISHGVYANVSFLSGMYFHYSSSDASHVEAFVSDYDAIKALLELEYVRIIIQYNYGLPRCYFGD